MRADAGPPLRPTHPGRPLVPYRGCPLAPVPWPLWPPYHWPPGATNLTTTPAHPPKGGGRRGKNRRYGWAAGHTGGHPAPSPRTPPAPAPAPAPSPRCVRRVRPPPRTRAPQPRRTPRHPAPQRQPPRTCTPVTPAPPHTPGPRPRPHTRGAAPPSHAGRAPNPRLYSQAPRPRQPPAIGHAARRRDWPDACGGGGGSAGPRWMVPVRGPRTGRSSASQGPREWPQVAL